MLLRVLLVFGQSDSALLEGKLLDLFVEVRPAARQIFLEALLRPALFILSLMLSGDGLLSGVCLLGVLGSFAAVALWRDFLFDAFDLSSLLYHLLDL